MMMEKKRRRRESHNAGKYLIVYNSKYIYIYVSDDEINFGREKGILSKHTNKNKPWYNSINHNFFFSYIIMYSGTTKKRKY